MNLTICKMFSLSRGEKKPKQSERSPVAISEKSARSGGKKGVKIFKSWKQKCVKEKGKDAEGCLALPEKRA